METHVTAELSTIFHQKHTPFETLHLGVAELDKLCRLTSETAAMNNETEKE